MDAQNTEDMSQNDNGSLNLIYCIIFKGKFDAIMIFGHLWMLKILKTCPRMITVH
jgi:hypothetical protein